MDKQEIKRIFEQAQAIITGSHFVYAKKADGWYHGPDYVNKDAIYPYTRFVSPLCKEIADHFRNQSIEVVVGPTVGGVSLSQWVAHWMAPSLSQKEVLAVYADEEEVTEIIELSKPKEQATFIASGEVRVILSPADQIEKIVYRSKVGTRRVIRRGYDKKVKGRRCLIVEDIINSGNTVKKTCDAIKEAGGQVLGVGALCNRSGDKVTAESLGVFELFSLFDVDMVMFKEEVCPICAEKGKDSVRTDLGKGKEFLSRIGKDP
jgi:orotate phosphoribosyltransferase